jgi:bifunctional non-homologous end joining protein LigD
MQPTMLVFDLDPGPPANIVQCCEVGLQLHELFLQLGLESSPKTSGSKGLQVYIPLNSAVTYEQTKPFAHAVARWLEEQAPKGIVSDMKKSLRVNKVFVDWSQNDDHKTTVCVYSLRAKERPTVSTSVTWDEVKECLEERSPDSLVFTSDQVLERVGKFGDLFEPVLTLKQRLPANAKLPARMAELYEKYAPKKRETASSKANKSVSVSSAPRSARKVKKA